MLTPVEASYLVCLLQRPWPDDDHFPTLGDGLHFTPVRFRSRPHRHFYRLRELGLCRLWMTKGEHGFRWCWKITPKGMLIARLYAADFPSDD